jgi:hypothetical protein
MANVNSPFGLRSIGRCLDGGPFRIQQFLKAVGYGTALFTGDAVNRVADASIDKTATPGTTAYSGVNLNYGAASTATTHLVIVSPGALFVVQANGSTVVADIGLNANLSLGAGSATTLQSGHVLASSTQDTTNTLDMHLLEHLNVPDNDATANYARVIVTFNKHRMAPATAGV